MDTLKTSAMVDFLKAYYKVFENQKWKDDKDFEYVHLHYSESGLKGLDPLPILASHPAIPQFHETVISSNEEFMKECLKNAQKNIINRLRYSTDNTCDAIIRKIDC